MTASTGSGADKDEQQDERGAPDWRALRSPGFLAAVAKKIGRWG